MYGGSLVRAICERDVSALRETSPHGKVAILFPRLKLPAGVWSPHRIPYASDLPVRRKTIARAVVVYAVHRRGHDHLILCGRLQAAIAEYKRATVANATLANTAYAIFFIAFPFL